MVIIENIAELSQWVGKTLGPSEWITVDQKRIDDFAACTGDHQWIHVDPERAARESPGGKTIAHGFLTLSLLPALQHTLYEIRNVSRALNYGANRVRFLAPVPSGSRVRLSQTIKAAEPTTGGVRLIVESSFEIEGQAKPALIAETIALFFD